MKCPTGIIIYCIYPSYLSMRELVAVLISKNCLFLNYLNYLFFVFPLCFRVEVLLFRLFLLPFLHKPTHSHLGAAQFHHPPFKTEAAAQQHPSSIYLHSFWTYFTLQRFILSSENQVTSGQHRPKSANLDECLSVSVQWDQPLAVYTVSCVVCCVRASLYRWVEKVRTISFLW